MGVMSKLLQSHQAPPTPLAEPLPAVGTPSAAERSVSGAERSNTWPSHWPDPAPCTTCGSPGFWIDVYGGGPHCRGCNPPSSPSLVAMPAWVIDWPDGSAVGRQWIRDPRRAYETQGDRGNTLAGEGGDDSEFVTWTLPGGQQSHALRERIDHTRVASERGRYSPPLACGPVGDLTLDEWFERLPELPPAGIRSPAA